MYIRTHFPKRSCFGSIAAISWLVTAACHHQSMPAPAIQTISISSVEELTSETTDKYSAVVTPFTQVDLNFKSPGIVRGIHQIRGSDGRIRTINAGDQIRQGTSLAFVRPADYEHAVSQAQAQVSQAQAQLNDATVGLENSQLNWDRSRNLFASASLIKPQYDQAESSYRSAQAKVDAAKAALANANAALDQTKLTLGDTIIRSPFTGWITARNVEVGSLSMTSAAAFSMVDTHLVKANFAIPDIALQSVHLGKQYDVLLDAVPHPVRGTVTSISQQADSKSHVFAVELTIPNAGDIVRPGMIGSLTLTSSQAKESHLVVPLSAIVRAPERSHGFAVFTLEDHDGKTYARSQSIEIGKTYGNSVEVTKGLLNGEQVIGIGGSLLRNGQEVRVLP